MHDRIERAVFMFEWHEKFNTGIKLIDEQHKELFAIASRVRDLFLDQYAFDKYDRLIVLITELRDYTLYHFKTEEHYMQEVKYKKYFSHKVQHDDFAKKLQQIDFHEIDQNQDQYIEELLGIVSSWIISHILENDKFITAG